jgi:hypothetical protein
VPSKQQDRVAEKARIDRDLIASLRESSRPLRPEASLTAPTSRNGTNADLQAILETSLRGSHGWKSA